MRNREVDSVVGVSDGVELFVAILIPNKILVASASLGGGTFTAWKRRSSERSFRLTCDTRWSRRANALNFTARQSRFQDVGRGLTNLRRTRAYQRVQLIDEDDRVPRLHQLLHNVFRRSSTGHVFGARHD